MDKLGVIVNPVAGGGLNQEKIEKIKFALENLKEKLRFSEVYIEKKMRSKLEGLGLELERFCKVREVDLLTAGNREDTLRLTKTMDEVVDAIAVFGGDGTMSDVASAFPRKPLICIGIGTTNVSPVLTEGFENLDVVEVSGLFLTVGDERRIAFNDVVVGSTILSTIDGKRVQVDAEEFMKGKKVVAKPRKFHAEVRVGERVLSGEFGNIFVSIPDKRFLGKGIAGGTSLSAFLGFKGVVACISEGIVVSTYSKEDLIKMEPIVTKTLSFDDEVVEIVADEVISCDGNPVGKGYGRVRVVDGVVRVLKGF